MHERSGFVEGGGVERAGAGEGRRQKKRARNMNRIAIIQTAVPVVTDGREGAKRNTPLLRANCTRTRHEQHPIRAAGLLVPFSPVYREAAVVAQCSGVQGVGSYASLQQTTPSVRTSSMAQRQASVFFPLMFMAHDPQIPSRHDRRNVRVGSCLKKPKVQESRQSRTKTTAYYLISCLCHARGKFNLSNAGVIPSCLWQAFKRTMFALFG